jgi:hypothetical protein
VRIADEVASTLTSPSELAQPRNTREDICATKELDVTFAENRVNNVAGSNTLKNQYFATSHGMFRKCASPYATFRYSFVVLGSALACWQLRAKPRCAPNFRRQLPRTRLGI